MQEIEHEHEYRPPRLTEYEKARNQRLPSEIPQQTHNSRKTGRERLAEPLGTMALHWPQEIDQVSIPESGLAGLACFSSVSFFSRQGFLDS